MISFGSDNHSGIHPKILKAIERVNQEGHSRAYGDDYWTQKLKEKFEELFSFELNLECVLTGTGANIVNLLTVLRPWESVLCSDLAHIWVDECGAPERLTGSKLIPVPNRNGKLQVEDLRSFLSDPEFEHETQVKVISITQPTELGTLYSLEEMKEIKEFAHENGLLVHLDGARISNAVSALGISLKELPSLIDFMSFGGTKNGMMMGEAVIFFHKDLSKGIKYARKQSAQLFSKMRFLSAQFLEWFEDDLWLKNASHANKMAKRLEQNLKGFEGVEIIYDVDANGVFAKIPKEANELIFEEGYFFYVWDEKENVVRWMTSFDTTKEDVDNFSNLIKQIVKKCTKNLQLV